MAFMEEARRLLETLKEQIYYFFAGDLFQNMDINWCCLVCYVHELEPQSFPVSVFYS